MRFPETEAGGPVDLDDLRALPLTHDTARAATDRIMASVTGLVAELRQQPAPARPWQPEPHLEEPAGTEAERPEQPQ